MTAGIGGRQTGCDRASPRGRMEAMPSNRWDAVIFDYGRVLSLAPSAAELRLFAALVGVSEPPFFEIYSATRHEYDCGRADFHQHWQSFADAADVKLEPEQVERIAEMETLMWLRVNHAALALAREVKAHGVRIAILSNMPHDLLAYVRREFDWLDEFEVKVWSCEFGATKPDPAIYRHCLGALACEPKRALFFDDRANNVEAAMGLGMDAHLFESTEQARAIVRAGLNSSQ
jgi:putative hydrolase of the HAD superfamily